MLLLRLAVVIRGGAPREYHPEHEEPCNRRDNRCAKHAHPCQYVGVRDSILKHHAARPILAFSVRLLSSLARITSSSKPREIVTVTASVSW